MTIHAMYIVMLTSTGTRKASQKPRPLDKSTRPPFERMMRIHNAISAKTFPNCTSLGREFEVSAKTVGRDLDFMRDRLKLPIGYNHGKRGYEYTKDVEGFPMIQVTESELLALFVAQKVMAQFNRSVFEKTLAQSFQKIAPGLSGDQHLPSIATNDVISFKTSGSAKLDLKLFFELHGAIIDRHEVEFRYRRRGEKTQESRSLQPHFIHGALNAWYLIGFDSTKKEFRVFALHRMTELTIQPQQFQRAENVTLESLLDSSLGVYVSEERFTIRVRFDAFAADLIRERHWHTSQKIEELPNGGVELELTLNSLFEVEQWVLGWGFHAEVLEPPELRERLTNHARKMMETYP